MTKREFLNMVVNGTVNEDAVNYAKAELEKLDTRNQNKRPTARQVENEELVEVVFETLATSDKPLMVKEIVLANDKLSDLSYQRVSALVKKLVDTNRVVRTVIKKNSYFSVAN